MDIDPKDLNISTYNPDPHSGGWSLNRNRGVHIIHKPSGMEAKSDMDRSVHRNRAEAMRLLQIKVDAWAEFPAAKSEVFGYLSRQVPNPHKIDFAQMRKDMDNGVMLCRLNILQAVIYGAELQARENPVVQVFDASVIAEGRIASIDTDAKEQ